MFWLWNNYTDKLLAVLLPIIITTKLQVIILISMSPSILEESFESQAGVQEGCGRGFRGRVAVGPSESGFTARGAKM